MIAKEVPDGPLLVDTDVVSYWTAGSPLGSPFAELVAGHELAISFATYGELLANGHRNRWGERRLATLRAHLRQFVAIPYDQQVVEIWASLHAKLSGHLHKGGTNDLWTAACALSLDPRLPVVTNNLKDFQTIAGESQELQLIHPCL